ncbi:hypothetical protein K9U39_19085 [Rhodoblastus acidophilus]|uniref:O-antigen ligase domain-containing protein n=1 Tax=Candidatus Rhodoblastus alkanivorans TaxID=2954117 RepID=A0ABS9Z456_9HYPH|nr:hypothetical protein [Candidatus Rhodoblastus alkanivorans]MCI4679724.1 hypothetical protein [Candidatus Rhodoblastus alkanivorans]MCI4681962.1 hypothetical protein [Candidatus Rhodoblastus alkanivorans]MDI4643012.1 hypothetical protein [Rhodoblastus acidophilus]
MIDRNIEDKASEDAANLLLRIGVGAAFIATPLFQLVSQRAIFILPPVAGALILGAGLVLAPRMRTRDIFAFLLSAPGLAGAFLAFWMLLSLLWTPFPSEAAPRLIKALLTLACVLPAAASLPARTRAANLYFLPLGVALTAVGALILATPLLSDGVETEARENLGIGMDAALLLLWPALAATHLRQRATLSAALVIVAVAAAVAVPAPGALAATALAGLAFAFALRGPRRAGKWLGRIGAALFVLAPLGPLLLNLKAGPDAPHWLVSLKLWRSLIVNDGVRLITGHGFNFVSSGFWRGYMPPQAPRTMLFEAWTDLGLVGVAAAAVLTRLAYQAAANQSERLAPFWIGALTYVFAMGLFGLATTQAWWITTLALGLAAFAFVARGDYKTARPSPPR